MNTKFWPSLELIAYARIAQGILYTFDLDDLERTFPNIKYIQTIVRKISEIVLPTYCATFSRLNAARRNPEDQIIVHLPLEVQKQLRGIVIALGLEINKWFESHRFIMQEDSCNLKNKLSWFSFGVIDRLETARHFIHDEGWDIEKRFHLACKYCFEDDAQMLWRNMAKSFRRSTMIQLPRARNIRLWLDKLHRLIPGNRGNISYIERLVLFRGNYVGIGSYFPKLRDPEIRHQCIYFALETGVVHHYDLYSCISLLNADEFNSILKVLETREFCELFKTFLQWPFQIIFLDIVNDFKEHISEDIFYGVVTFILTNELEWEFQDHMYIEIFKPFWNLFSAMYERRIQTNVELYNLATYVLEHSKDYNDGTYRQLLNLYFSSSTLE
ncbi:uncharacterized protein TNCV_4143551 [Trichonephila clavipes]|nr:uncharacterized protein TNCV_4143551 [Trichonephila clavipes]